MSIAFTLPGTLAAVSDLTALHAAILAAPEDDAPRAAYAAAVATTDPERSELISLQLRLDASRKAQRPSDERGAAAMRAGTLMRARGADWARDIAPLVARTRFVRGFVEDVLLDAPAFLASASQLYATAPILHLTLTNVRAVDPLALFTSPHLERLRSLDLARTELGDLEVALLASQRLPNLRWLSVAGNNVTRAGLDALASTASLPALGYVDLSANLVADPMPGLVDEESVPTALALELIHAHGPIAWLDLHRFRDWPPERDALP